MAIKTIYFRGELNRHPHWHRTPYWIGANNERRSGMSKLIIAYGIAELLSTGKCIIKDHPHTNHTAQFYDSFIKKWFYHALQGLFYDVPFPELVKMFPYKVILREGLCVGIYIEATNGADGHNQYQTGYYPDLISDRLEKQLSKYRLNANKLYLFLAPRTYINPSDDTFEALIDYALQTLRAQQSKLESTQIKLDKFENGFWYSIKYHFKKLIRKIKN